MNSYSRYRGQNLGRILHFMHEYFPHHISEYVCVGCSEVRLGEELVAKFHFHKTKYGDFETDVPIFDFTEKYKSGKATQAQKIVQAITESWGIPFTGRSDVVGLTSLGVINYKPPFNRPFEELSLMFDRENMCTWIYNDDGEEISKMHFFSPCTYDIEREVKFRMAVSSLGIYALNNEPLIKEYI